MFPGVTATITAYGVGLFIHVLAVVVMIGPTFAYGIFIGTAESGYPRSVPGVLRGIQRSDRYLVSPGLIVILLAGIYLMAKGHWDASESFIGVGFVAILILFGMVHGFFRPNTAKALELAERDLASGDTLSAEYAAVSKRLENAGKLAGAIVAITIFFMVVKP
jgi:amino acid permease